MLRSQTLINQLWQLELNYPDTVSWSASALNGAYLITTGNTFNGISQKTNIATTKTDQGGAVVWQAEYNGPLSGFDYGAALAVDAAGNVFIAGASHASDAYSFDVVVIKYNAAGVQQWATSFDGEANANDIPSAILLTGTDIYVCAASIGAASNYDYLLLKLNAAGAVLWNARYDYADLDDIPGHIAAAAADIIVSGASQSDTANWDYTSLKYNSSGTLINTKRTAAPGYGFDRPSGLVVDASGNFYISGYAFNGTDYDMRTIKLDDDLSTLWSKTENGGAQDGCNAICMDDGSNIYIAGFSENSAGNKCMQIIKYDSSGTKLWTKTLQNAGSDIRAEVTGITFNSENNKLIATGFYEYPSGKKTITTFALKTANGNINWKKDYPNIAESIDVPTGVLAKNNYVWVNGRRTVEDTTRYVTVKYEMYERDIDFELDTAGNPIYVKNEMIIRFNSDEMNLAFTDNKQTEFGNLSNVISSTLYNQIAPILKGQNAQFTPKAFKIYKNLTSNDTIATSRLGHINRIPKFYASAVVTFDASVNIYDVFDTLNSMKPDILWANPNAVGKLDDAPNDDEYVAGNQNALISTTFPDAHINIENAWDTYTNGDEDVQIGIFDTGLDYKHDDLVGTDDPDEIDFGLKTNYGFDFSSGVSLDALLNSDVNGHGTSVAGIAAAVRNNAKGVAGVAGGDDAVDNNGATLQAFKVFDDYGYATMDAVSSGLYYASIGVSPLGITDIMNHSWGAFPGTFSYNPIFINELKENIRFAFKQEAITVASRGNSGLDEPTYPATFFDDWVISTGASGDDGEKKYLNYPGPTTNGTSFYSSSFGSGMDVLAPGDASLVTTTESGTDSYHTFAGTSAAAPHVSGLAALILSYAPIILAPEDVEHVIEYGAADRNLPETNYDDESGWGLIDAEECMKLIELPENFIQHYESAVTSYTTLIYNQPIVLTDDYDIYPAGTYLADIRKYTITITHTGLSAEAEFQTKPDRPGYWVRNSASNLWGPRDGDNNVIPESNVLFDGTPTIGSATITGYSYRLRFDPDVSLNQTIPYEVDEELGLADNGFLAYSILVHDKLATGMESAETQNEISIYPNPSYGIFTINFQQLNEKPIIEIYNLQGVKIKSVSLGEETNVMINIKSYPAGLYFVKCIAGEEIITKQIIKIN